MIVIKKKLSTPRRSTLKSKLSDYFELSKNKNKISKGSLINATLKCVIPLAAASIIPGQQLSAQCMTSNSGGSNYNTLIGGCFYADGGFYGLDVDGDGSFDFGWGAPQSASTSYSGTTTTTGGAQQRNFVASFNTSFLMFGLGGAAIGATPIPNSSTFSCATAALTTTAYFWSFGAVVSGIQTYPVGGTTWTTVAASTSSTSSGNLPPGPFSFPITSSAGSCGWIELTYGFISNRTVMCFDSGGVEDALGGDDGLNIVHVGECESLSDAILPVVLNNFVAKPEGNVIQLSWETLVEVNNKGFEIQRSSDGVSFHKLAFVDGRMNSSREENYNYTDQSVLNNTLYYYRLKQLDVNGGFEYSNIVQAELKSVSRFYASEFYPNPVSTNEVFIDVNLVEEQEIRFEVYDAFGSLIKEYDTNGLVGLHKYTLDVNSLGEGSYFVKILSGKNTKYGKIIKF